MRQRLASLAPVLAAMSLPGLLLPIQRGWSSGTSAASWLLDLAAHWQPWYATAWLVACLLGGLRNHRWLMFAPVALLPVFTASPRADRMQGPPDIVIATANVQKDNHDPGALETWLRLHPANIIVINELSDGFARALADGGHAGFAFHALHPSDAVPGIGILSDRPLHDPQVFTDPLGALRMEADIEVANRKIRLVAVHPKPPNAIRKHLARDRLIRNLANEAARRPMIVAGDLNATPWSSALRGPHSTHLKRATGAMPTWPTALRGIIGVAIDHVLVSPDLALTSSERGPCIGSDHYPLLTGLQLGGSNANRSTDGDAARSEDDIESAPPRLELPAVPTVQSAPRTEWETP